VISDGLKLNAGAGDGAKNQTSPDRLILAGGSAASAIAVECYTYYLSPFATAAVHVDTGYRVVFFGFALRRSATSLSCRGSTRASRFSSRSSTGLTLILPPDLR